MESIKLKLLLIFIILFIALNKKITEKRIYWMNFDEIKSFQRFVWGHEWLNEEKKKQTIIRPLVYHFKCDDLLVVHTITSDSWMSKMYISMGVANPICETSGTVLNGIQKAKNDDRCYFLKSVDSITNCSVSRLLKIRFN